LCGSCNLDVENHLFDGVDFVIQQAGLSMINIKTKQQAVHIFCSFSQSNHLSINLLSQSKNTFERLFATFGSLGHCLKEKTHPGANIST